MSLWSLVIDVFEPEAKPKNPKLELSLNERLLSRRQAHDMFASVDFVPPSLPISYGRAKLFIVEDNDSVNREREEPESQTRRANTSC